MQIFLVGGAVRDKLLGYPSYEKDWVVVGATPEQLLEQGFRPVGKDFPVFLHPRTKEEYALARTERKTAPGYTGFQFHADPDVTLEEDLARRDLTINAIAESESGELVDPFHGRADIEQRILRHVSPAFAEDPVRILRIARFAARYCHLGFTVAPETMALMRTMVESGEVDHLVAERVWKELQRALMEETPAQFIEVVRACGALERIMPELDRLFGVPQPPAHHPEVDTGRHTLMSLQQAAKAGAPATARFATLLHDVGKGTTPSELLPSHHAHEQRGLKDIKALCQRLAVPKEFRDLALAAAEFHTHCHRALELSAKTVVKLFMRLDAFRRPQRFREFLVCCEADARGRTGFENREYPQAEYLAGAFEACRALSIQPLLEQGLTGQPLGEAIYRLRLQAVQHYRQQYEERHG